VIDTQKVRKRGRPLSFDPESAVETAMNMFHAKGYDGVSVADLVDALGIKPPSFYAAFGSKAGLFERTLERYTATEQNLFPNALEKGGSVAEVLARTFEDAARLYPKRNGVAGCLVLDSAKNSGDAEARAMTARLTTEFHEALVAFIASEYPAKAEAIADFVQTVLAGMSGAARDGMDHERLASIATIAGRSVHGELDKGNRSA
jgi:TetR/AcrR family transcriptional repressor for divergent bdcA